MRTRISRLIFSNLSRQTSIFENPGSPLPLLLLALSAPKTLFSTIPNRPMNSDRSKDDPHPHEEHGRPPPQFATGSLRDEKIDVSIKISEDNQFTDTLFQKLKIGDAGNDNVEEAAQNRKASEPPSRDADEIFKKMKEAGLVPNAVTMLDGLCKDGLVQEAMKLFRSMREKGTMPEVVIYTAVVEGFCEAAKFDDAMRILRKMQKNGVAPNAYSYAVLIQGLCGGGRLEDAVEFCCEMLDAGHSPNAVTFTALVDGLCKEKGLEEAKSVVRRMREKGLAVNEKAVREHMDKKGPFSRKVWEAIFGKKSSQKPF